LAHWETWTYVARCTCGLDAAILALEQRQGAIVNQPPNAPSYDDPKTWATGGNDLSFRQHGRQAVDQPAPPHREGNATDENKITGNA
jgi:hypothetical protein